MIKKTNSIFVSIASFILPQFVYANSTSENEKLNSIANEYLSTFYAYDQERMGSQKIENARYDVFNDHSLKALYKFKEYQNSTLSALSAIDPSQLTNDARITHVVLLKYLQAEQQLKICRNELWEMNTMFPWFSALADLVETQPVGNENARQNALKRWQGFAVVADNEIEKLKEGLKQGYTAPKTVLPRIINQIDSILNSPIQSSPFFVPGNRDLDQAFQEEFAKVIVEVINPALLKYKNFLLNEYLPQAREDIGVSAHPNGKQCYQAMVNSNTTKNFSPEEIRSMGLDAVAELETKLENISKKYFGGISIKELMKLTKESRYPFETEQAVLDYNLKALDRVNGVLSQIMTVKPESSFEIRPYPAYLAESGSVGEYHLPTKDGTQPGIFFINTANYKNGGYADMESTLFHEAIPGHHLQLSLVIENKILHPLVELLSNNASVEGWGLYAETLAAKFNLYSSPLSEVGHLTSILFRAARLVIDTGLHVDGWTKEHAASYLREHTLLPETQIYSEIDRYLTIGGQATSYYIGLKAILLARHSAETQLGNKFSLQKFHDHLLTLGIVPLDYMLKSVEDWVQTEMAF